MKRINPARLAEGQRHLGVILAAAGVIAGLLEGANPVMAAGIATLGAWLMYLGALED
jgi:hypothetical protein